ncbi:TPA: trigger factor [bacterium]|nr:trigger factor [bacterium]
MIKVDLIRKDEWTVELDISVDRERTESEFSTACKDLNRSIRLPGFRQGKIPRSVLEARMNQDLQKKVVESLVFKSYQEAVNQTKIVPITLPRIENIDYKKNEYLKFRAHVEVRPEIPLGDYKGISLEKRIKKVTTEDIEQELKYIQERGAELVGVDDRPARVGDIVSIDYEGFVEGIPIPGAKKENVSIELGKTKLLPGIEEEVIGMEVNTSKEIRINLPENYPVKEFANQLATFKVGLKSIKVKRLPSIDDELARDVGKENLNELREAIRVELERFNEDQAKRELKNMATKTLVANSDFSPPKSLIEKEVDQMINEFENNLRPIGLTIERYLKEKEIALEELRDDFRPKAIENLKAGFILDIIADREGIQATEEEVEEGIEDLANAFSKTKEEMKKLLADQGEVDGLCQRIRRSKTADFLVTQSQIEEIYE